MPGESTQDTHDHGSTARVSQELSAASFQGTSLPAKTLALTFDDGPGPRTKELSMYLKAQNIKAAFFVNGARLAATALPNPNGLTVVTDPAGTLAQLLADGHLVANHTTTHRDLTSGVSDGQRVQELSDTDTDITGYVSPQNHLLFRAPFGAYNGTVFATLSASAMNKYIGPIYWEAGGYDMGYPNRAADWACWQGAMKDGANALINVGNDPGFATTQQCGDAYIAEIENTFPKGIVLLHDPYAWSKGAASGSTVDMVKYIVPILVGKGYSFVRVDEVPTIAAALPPQPCDPTCATCSGPGANACTACPGGRYKSGSQCLTCATCNGNQYVATVCGGSTNTVCAACAACGPGKYQSAACTTTTDTVCGSCDASCTVCSGPGAAECGSCPASFFLSGGACKACKVCAAGTYQAAACTPIADTTCTACGNCDDGNACTQDRCDPAKGCLHDEIAGCLGTPSTSGGLGVDVGSGVATDAGVDGGPATEGGCSVSGRPGRGRDGRIGGGLLVLAVLGMSLTARLARRRRPQARSRRVG